ncbi:MAG: selenocysteine-specific translation elongation factor [Acidimicrobiia bacterium]|nr:selenocysteine-specific translation elongation factor [Acidimicrobiia bacterium]NNF87263.1 selenocysteine-specific translation elongation factor [Acidimicrobiia bacterium]NNL98380.1 selenocysteine-specific translation elongation factor [Acidimicrobiia bacterium]
MPIVGTAGHVDHGKSTLIQALTGRDPDRLAEEKARGLTIDLGFAWTDLPSGTTIGFVDVPGHERFIKNMLAGIDAVNVGLLVVASDEGWMPQSEEHLAVLDLLELSHIVIALTRTSLADEETVELARAEIEDHVERTVAAGAPIIAVDSISGRGIDELVAALDQAVAATDVVDNGRPRMWVDRSFTIAGAGTVVTGTLLDGSLSVGDEVAIVPELGRARIRGIQSHEESHEHLDPGTRTALNLSGLATSDVPRGAMLGRPGDWVPTVRSLAALRTVRSLSAPLQDRGAYHLHVGSGSWPARLRLLDGPELAGSGHAILTTDHPIPLKMGDRFILREVGRRSVVAGGRILEPRPAERVRSLDVGPLEVVLDASPDDQAATLLAGRGTASVDELAAHTGGGRAAAAVIGGHMAVDPEVAGALLEQAVGAVETYQQANPLRPGMPKASLASGLGIELELLNVLLLGTNRLTGAGTSVTTSGFTVELDAAQTTAWEAARARLESGLAVPTLKELGLSTELVYALVRAGSLLRVSSDLVYLPDQIAAIVSGLTDLPEGFTVADFRDHFGLTRKYAVPLLEWLDAEGHTIRRGDVRGAR